MTSTATPHYASRIPQGWAVSWLGDRTVTRNQAVTAMLIAVEVATKDLDVDQAALRLVEDLAGELGLSMSEAIEAAGVPRGTTEQPEPAEVEGLDLVARIERVRARIEPSGPQAQRMFMILLDAVLTDIELSEDENDVPLFLAEELAAFVGRLIRGEWRPVAEALAARESQKAS